MKKPFPGFALIASLAIMASCSKPSIDTEGIESEATEGTILIVNADIVTMNPEAPSANALAFVGGRIIAVGTESEVRNAIGDYDKTYDLEGLTIVPGFIESHDHLFMSSLSAVITDVSPFTTPTLAGALKKISSIQPDDEGWIIAFGADQELYEERQGPLREMLDVLFPNDPVVVFHLSGHGGFANSKALELAGIDKSTPDPQGGFYEKDASGELTGYLAGQSAVLSVKHYPNATPETARIAAAERAAQGVTTGSEFAIMDAGTLAQLAQATSTPGFSVRLVGGYFSSAPDIEEMIPRLKSYENGLLTMRFIKTWTDGSPQGGTANFSEGYYDPDMGGDGAQGTQKFFNEQVLRMYESGFWPAVHANGDGAIDVAMNAVQYAQETLGEEASRSIRPQIIHAQYTRPEQFERMRELNISPTFFTTHVYYWGDLHYEKTLGPERAQRLSAMADAFDAGVHPAMHNDPPVTPVNPLLNMSIAINRKSSSGRVLGADQAISARQALESYTINPAYQFGIENDAGSLEVGKYADFVVLDRNPLKINPDEISDIRVLTTFMGGNITYSNTSE